MTQLTEAQWPQHAGLYCRKCGRLAHTPADQRYMKVVRCPACDRTATGSHLWERFEFTPTWQAGDLSAWRRVRDMRCRICDGKSLSSFPVVGRLACRKCDYATGWKALYFYPTCSLDSMYGKEFSVAMEADSVLLSELRDYAVAQFFDALREIENLVFATTMPFSRAILAVHNRYQSQPRT